MKRCKLKNPIARDVVASVWKHLRARFPNDARILAEIVCQIAPLSRAEAADGTKGQWFLTYLNSFEELCAFFQRYSHGQGYGTIKLLDSDELTAGIVAHELGHAFANEDEIFERASPQDEWASEAAADMHAVRWGLLTCEDIRRRHTNNVEAGGGLDAAFHHGPPPGGNWIQIPGGTYRLREDFVFERITDFPQLGT